MKKTKKKIWLTTLLAFAAAALAFNFLPVYMTVFENPQDPELTPYGEILPGHPLIRCASDISNFGRYGEISVSPMLATYNRINTGHYAMRVFMPDGYNSYLLHEEIFSAAELQDNKYRAFTLTPASVMPGPLCFSLTTADSVPGNAITVWLNSNSDPVLKITAATHLSDLLAGMAGRGYFGLGREVLFGLFFACLFVQLWLIIYLAGAIHEREKIPKPAHHQRTG